MTIHTFRKTVLILCLALISQISMAQDRSAFAGRWVINASLSDNTDKQVERALRAMGQKVDRCWLNCQEDRFRGGPEEQELYDRISYDKTLTIEISEPEYLFTYDDSWKRSVYTDGRSQSVSLTGLAEAKDFSMAHWENNSLQVEARPRDGGFANETYTLINNGLQLRVEMYIQPRSFTESLEITRIYDKVSTN